MRKRSFVLLFLGLCAVAAAFFRTLLLPVPQSGAQPELMGTLAPTATPEPLPAPPPEPTEAPFSALAPTTAMSFAELVGDNGNYDAPAGYPSPDTYRVVVDIAHQVVILYTRDGEGEYTVPVRYMLCSTGLGDRTPTGVFQIKRYRVRFGLFQNDKTYGQYWTLIQGRIYFHSTLYEERDANTYIGETYDLLGTKASHGCIRVPVPDARFIYYNLGHGTEVEIREGDPNDAELAAIRAQLVLPERPEAHVTLLPGQIPDTDNWRIADVPQELPYEEGSQKEQR